MASHWHKGYADGWTGVDWTLADGNVGIDPYLVWAEATKFVDLGVTPHDKMRVPVIVELGNDRTAQQFAERVEGKGVDWPWIQTSELYRNPVTGLENTTFCTANVMREFFVELGKDASELREWVKRFELGLPMRPPSAEAQGILTRAAEAELQRVLADAVARMAPVAAGTRARSPIVGIIDDGLAFAHERFQTPDRKTRIAFFWNQGYPKSEPMEKKVTPAAGYGLEFAKKAVDDLMKASESRGLVDEDLFYRKAGYLEVSRYWAHGTHVMDLACGSDPDKVDQSSPRIICVQIQPPSRTTRDRSTGWLAIHVLDGLRYILHRAAKLAPPKMIVVNLSFGHIAGPHDGSSILEAAIEQLIDAYSGVDHQRLEVVVAAGNSLLARCHASFSLDPEKCKELDWRILPDDATPSFMEIWLRPEREGELSEIKVEVTTPWGDSNKTLNPAPDTSYVHTWRPGDQVLGAVIRLRTVATGNAEMILLAVAPTQRLGQGEKAAPCGTWSVRIINCGDARVGVEAYIERDETPYGFPRRGRQSRFDDPNYVRFDKYGRLKEDDAAEDPMSPPLESHIKRADTINSIATGDRTVVIAGFRGSERATVKYSSEGEPINAAATTEDSITCHGVLAAGSRSASRVAMNGTSVAAPQITRELARLVMKPATKGKTGRQIVNKVGIDAELDPTAASRAPPEAAFQFPRRRLGNGRVDARPNAKDFLRRISHRRKRRKIDPPES
jgi:Subtilase family